MSPNTCLNCGQEVSGAERFCPRCGVPQRPTRLRASVSSLGWPLPRGTPYLHAFQRFWWLGLVALAVAGLAAISSVYRIGFSSIPPSLEKRAQISYASSARILVTSDEAPFFRTTVTRVLDVPATDEAGGTRPVVSSSAPDIGTLVLAANLYPIFIESDEVREIRDRMFGPLPGSVSARAIYAVASASRFELSQVPVVEIFAVAATHSGAVDLAQGTVDAFVRFMDQTQDRAGLKQEERILVKQLQRPEAALASGDASLGLPLLLFVAVIGAFVALTLLLDRLLPLDARTSRLPSAGEVLPEEEDPAHEREKTLA